MAGLLAHICRHPIKSIGWEALRMTDLSAGKVLPFDRHWALAHDAAAFEGQPEVWQTKRNFVRGAASPTLMAVKAHLSPDGKRVSLSHPDAAPLEIAPDTEEGSRALCDWIRPMWPANRPEPNRIVSAGSQALTDVSDPFVSVLSVTSNRDLGERIGEILSIHRWRGNLWLDGFPPFEEFNWIGHRIRIGGAVLRIRERITRCNATRGNPETGIADADTLGALQNAFGHRDFGVYATIETGGHIRVGDKAELL